VIAAWIGLDGIDSETRVDDRDGTGEIYSMPSTRMSFAFGIVVLMCSAHAHAECTMDTECEGDRICENGSCVDPSPAAPPVATAPRPQASAAPTSAAPTSAAPTSAAPGSSPPSPPTRLVPHSEVMKGVGILSVVMGGVAFVGALGVAFSEAGCGFGNIGSLGSSCGNNNSDDGNIAGGLLSAAVLVAVGVPLIVVGNRKEPASPKKSARVSPWVERQSAGLSLRFDL
jgi:hypothetical protein